MGVLKFLLDNTLGRWIACINILSEVICTIICMFQAPILINGDCDIFTYYIVWCGVFLSFIVFGILFFTGLTFCINSRKLHRGDLIAPWKRGFGKNYKEDAEFVIGFVPITVPFVNKCINNLCKKQTTATGKECVHCHTYRELYKREPPAKQRLFRMILMMNNRKDNEFGKLPRDLVVDFIKNYL